MTGGFKDHFSQRAPGYASHRPHYAPAVAEWLASVAPSRDLAWDAGCGSGQLSTLLGDQFNKVIATDASAAQIAHAVPHPRVEYRVEPAERPSLGDGSADLITVAQAAHWLDLASFYPEARRVARPGGIIALVAYERTRIDSEIDPIVENFYTKALDGWWPPERKHIENGYRSLEFPFTRIDAPQFEMRASWTADQLLGYVNTWSAVRAMETARGTAATDRFAATLRDAYGDGPREIRWPMVVLAGRVS